MSTLKAADILNQIIDHGTDSSEKELILQADNYTPCLKLIESLLKKPHGKILQQNIALFGEMYATSDSAAEPNDILYELAGALEQANKSSPEKFEAACKNVPHFTKFAKVEWYTSHFSMLSALLDERTCKPDGIFKNYNLTPKDITDLGKKLSKIKATPKLLKFIDAIEVVSTESKSAKTELTDVVLTTLALVAESVKAAKAPKAAAAAATKGKHLEQ